MCNRCILLEHGKILEEGNPGDVIASYLNGDWSVPGDEAGKEALISRVSFHDENGKTLQFEPGQKTWCEIEVRGVTECEKLSVGLSLLNDDNYLVFNAATERLQLAPFSLKAGETKKVTFELSLHLAPGTYHVCPYIYRYDIQKQYDSRPRAGTIYVKSDTDVLGIANLYPKAKLG
jgi:hypothetical protein